MNARYRSANWGTRGKVETWDNNKTKVTAGSTLRLEFTGGTVYVR